VRLFIVVLAIVLAAPDRASGEDVSLLGFEPSHQQLGGDVPETALGAGAGQAASRLGGTLGRGSRFFIGRAGGSLLGNSLGVTVPTAVTCALERTQRTFGSCVRDNGAQLAMGAVAQGVGMGLGIAGVVGGSVFGTGLGLLVTAAAMNPEAWEGSDAAVALGLGGPTGADVLQTPSLPHLRSAAQFWSQALADTPPGYAANLE